MLSQLLFGAVSAQAVHAAADLRLADHLDGGSRSSAELAARTGAHAPSLARLLRALAGLGVVTETAPDRFALTDAGRGLQTGVPGSLHSMFLLLCGPEHWRSWGELAHSVRTGERGWDRALGLDWVEYLDRHPDRSEVFNRAMGEHTRAAAPGLVAAAQLERFGTLLDAGGGDGTLLAEALRTHPELEGVLFDLPAGVREARATLTGVADRCRIVAGDLFAEVPAGADAYLLKQVLHDWDDARAAAILGNVRAAMADDARVLILERMLPERAGPEDLPTLLVDLVMLSVNGGRERTEREFRALAETAGLELTRVSDAIAPFGYRVLEARPRT
jgi:hypothetical protein